MLNVNAVIIDIFIEKDKTVVKIIPRILDPTYFTRYELIENYPWYCLLAYKEKIGYFAWLLISDWKEADARVSTVYMFAYCTQSL